VLAWRAAVSVALGAILTMLGWAGLHVNEVARKLVTGDVAAMRKENEEQLTALKNEVRDASVERRSAQKDASELEKKITELNTLSKELKGDLASSASQGAQLRLMAEQAKETVAQARNSMDEARAVVAEGKANLTTLESKLAQLNKDAQLIDQMAQLTAEARNARVFRMILLHSNDAQAFDFDVPHGKDESHRVTLALKTGRIPSDTSAELTWELRRDGRASTPHTELLFPGKEMDVDDSEPLLLRLEAVRKQPFARSFLIITVQVKTPTASRGMAP
jgi:hypothetical protein